MQPYYDFLAADSGFSLPSRLKNPVVTEKALDESVGLCHMSLTAYLKHGLDFYYQQHQSSLGIYIVCIQTTLMLLIIQIKAIYNTQALPFPQCFVGQPVVLLEKFRSRWQVGLTFVCELQYLLVFNYITFLHSCYASLPCHCMISKGKKKKMQCATVGQHLGLEISEQKQGLVLGWGGVMFSKTSTREGQRHRYLIDVAIS